MQWWDANLQSVFTWGKSLGYQTGELFSKPPDDNMKESHIQILIIFPQNTYKTLNLSSDWWSLRSLQTTPRGYVLGCFIIMVVDSQPHNVLQDKDQEKVGAWQLEESLSEQG